MPINHDRRHRQCQQRADGEAQNEAQRDVPHSLQRPTLEQQSSSHDEDPADDPQVDRGLHPEREEDPRHQTKGDEQRSDHGSQSTRRITTCEPALGSGQSSPPARGERHAIRSYGRCDATWRISGPRLAVTLSTCPALRPQRVSLGRVRVVLRHSPVPALLASGGGMNVWCQTDWSDIVHLLPRWVQRFTYESCRRASSSTSSAGVRRGSSSSGHGRPGAADIQGGTATKLSPISGVVHNSVDNPSIQALEC